MSVDRKIAIIAAACAVFTFAATLPSMYAQNEPGYIRWAKEINRGVTGVGAHLTLKALVAACCLCFTAELLVAFLVGSFTYAVRASIVPRLWCPAGGLIQVGVTWMLWNGDNRHAHTALGWSSAGAYIAAVYTAAKGEDFEAKGQRKLEAAKAKERMQADQARRARQQQAQRAPEEQVRRIREQVQRTVTPGEPNWDGLLPVSDAPELLGLTDPNSPLAINGL